MVAKSWLACLAAAAFIAGTAAAATYPPGFTETTVFSGLTKPVAVRFAADGRVLVAEKSGLVKVFDDFQDPSATTVIDIETEVHNYLDRGLLGFALDPDFAGNGYVYLLYAYDFNPVTGQGPPYWGDVCPNPPGDTLDGCVIAGRLSRFKVRPDSTLDGGEQVLLQNNWCQQYPSHSLGALAFDATGALLVSAGDGAHYNVVDYGQGGHNNGPTPQNPCGDPPSGVGGNQSPPSAEGGALRSQDVRSSADPLAYNGALLRVDPATGAALPDNPLHGGAVSDDDRLIAYGLRNPYRFTVRPNTNEVWIGDVGWNTWEELDRVASTADGIVENFGWPCYEGANRQAGYDIANLALCETLYAQGAAAHTAPWYTYHHNSDVNPAGDVCSTGDSAIAGLAFYTTGAYPAAYENALFFADYARDCIYVVSAGAGGLPDLATRTAFGAAVTNPADLQRGPGGDLFYVDHGGGAIHRISFDATNTPPAAVIAASPTSGDVPLTVQFDGSGSSDPDPGATLFFDWDLDGDGQFDDSALDDPQYTYRVPGPVVVGLRVTDDDGATSTDTMTITPGSHAPAATIVSPLPALRWRVGQAIVFEGAGTDAEDGTLDAAAFHWDVVLHHCPGGPDDCHEHGVQSLNGVDNGVFFAPDHEWYAFLEFRLTVTDGGGLQGTDAVSVDPLAVDLTFGSSPSSLVLSVGGAAETAPFVETAIVGSTMTIGAASPQGSHYWISWSDGGESSHEIVIGEQPATLTATFAPCAELDPCDGLDNDCDGTADNGPVPTGSPRVTLSRTAIAWEPVALADGYDAVRGDLGALHATGGDFAAATAECLQDDGVELSVPYTAEPAPGEGSWFLVRAVNCIGPGTYDSGDAGIDASAGVCD